MITLAKHPDENRILMYWYTFKDGKNVYQFRSDAIVTEAEEEKLHEIHCTANSKQDLLKKCLEILNPYTEKIKELIKTEMAKPVTNDFAFDTTVEKIK